MITLSPFLRARGKESTAGEKHAEALNRVVSVLLQGIALHGFNYEPAAFAVFEKSIRKLRSEFDRASEEATALLIAGGAIRLLQEHNERAEQYLADRQNELEAVIALLSETVLDVARAAPDVMVRVKELERDISLCTRIEGMAAARLRLASCLADLRAEAMADPVNRQLPAGSGETDPVTGLPDSNSATAAIGRVWSRRMAYYAAVFALERLETINMRFGFQAGDQMLFLLGQHITQQLTPEDRLFRWRGPYLVMLMERRLPEAMVAAELARLAPVRLETALSFRDREVMVPISATWDLFPLSSLRNMEDLFRKLNEFAGCRSDFTHKTRKMSAAAT